MPPYIVICIEKGGYIGKTLEAGNSEERFYIVVDFMKNKKIVRSLRLCRYLFSLGFEKSSRFYKNNEEYWEFEKSSNLNEALDFYFYMRKKQQE